MKDVEVMGGGGIKPVDVLRWFNRNKTFLAATTFGAAIIAALVTFAIPRSFHAIALLRPVVIDPGQSPLNNGSLMGGLGGLAGAVLGAGKTNADDNTVTIAYMQSPQFARDFIQQENLLPEMYPGRWNAATKQWIGKPPSLDDAALDFPNRVRVDQDPLTGLVKLEVLWDSPAEAFKIARDLIAAVNKSRSEHVLRSAGRNLDYLEQRLAHEQVQEMRLTVASLASRELTRMMLAKSVEDYALEEVSPPYAPSYPVAPRRTIITLIGALSGFVGGLLFILVRRALQNK